MRVRCAAALGLLLITAMVDSAALPDATEQSMIIVKDEGTTSAPVAEVTSQPNTEAAKDKTTEVAKEQTVATKDQSAVESKEPTTEGPTPPLKMTEMDVRSDISLRYAHTAVVTRVKNPAKRAQEATFRVLLPETAFISGFTMILDGKPYKAYVKEKEEAKKIYTEAVSQGFGAAHVAAKARDSNHFTVSVNVEPSTVAVFNLTYEELLVRRNKVYNHAINLHPGAVVPKMTVTVHIKESDKLVDLRVPEVRTGNEVDATEDDAQNKEASIERSHDDREASIKFTPDIVEQQRLMDVYAAKSKESQSSSHRRHMYYNAEQAPTPEGVLGQFIVQYDVDRPKEGQILVSDGYFVHFFAPQSLPPLNKHVVFVLDTSGSMMGRKIKQLREAMRTILAELNGGDYFNIVQFDSSVKVFNLKEADEPAQPTVYNYDFSYNSKPTTLLPPSKATTTNVDKAKVIVSRLQASGGTNIYSALNVAVDLIQKGIGWTPVVTTAAPATNATIITDGPQALPLNIEGKSNDTPKQTELLNIDEKKDEGGKKLEPIIIFLTDGDPTVGETSTTKIINHLTEKNFGQNKASIFSLAFGEDADRSFLRKLSLRSDGFMRHIYEASDAALQLHDFYRQVSSPLLAHVTFSYPPEQVKKDSLTKNRFRTFYAGSETVVAGRIEDGVTELSPTVQGFCGVSDGDGFTRKKYEILPKVPVAAPRGEYLPLERLWAYLTVKQLLDEKEKDDTAADKDNKDDTPEKKALAIALKYEFVTPLTSLVVVKPNATKAVDAESVDKDYSEVERIVNGGGGLPLAAHSFGLSASPGMPAPQFAYSPLQPASLSAAPIYSSFASEPEDAELEEDLAAGGPAADTAPFVGLHDTLIGAAAHRPSVGYHALGHSRSSSHSVSPHLSSSGITSRRAPYPPGSWRTYPGSGAVNTYCMNWRQWNRRQRGSRRRHWSGPPPHNPYYCVTGSSGSHRHWGGHNWISNHSPPAHQYPYSWHQTAVSTTPRPPPPPATTPLPRLAALRLTEFPWVEAALDQHEDKIVLQVNGTQLQLELVKGDPPKSASGDSECSRATDGAGGVCVYLTRCDAAKNITAQLYADTYCAVHTKYAGVCCPRDKVDINTMTNIKAST